MRPELRGHRVRLQLVPGVDTPAMHSVAERGAERIADNRVAKRATKRVAERVPERTT